ncbi:hypothetical protein HELRODRAFT_183701 [Helobdella robusta]|uniref:Uncharacterized protein n=1 Tax=Helobdella robusta TaxID=6412 RepID=T1FK26_HELRO|nr:hypothetical protein HELRODRAFT_183701 [Helobdella robusta]ESO10376.1 hypothetical protein HELRODRAFT_183701 [Helobdella robusta]
MSKRKSVYREQFQLTFQGLKKKTAAAEGAFAYHVAFHSLSFKAADCTNRLISTVFAESETGRKFSSAQTKTQAIISRILAPKSIENLLSELGSEPFSIATDSSNFKEIKTFPIIIRYFSHEGLKLWGGLKSLVLSTDDIPKVLENLFSDDSNEIYFWFLQSSLQLFRQTLLILEKKRLVLPEMIESVENLSQKLTDRMQKNFVGAMTQSKLQSLEDSNLANRIEKEFSTFYSTSVDYIQKWFRITDYPSSSKWLMLKSVDTILYEDIRKSAEFLMPEISVKDSLFDETSLLISLLKDSKESFHELPIDIKWTILF